MWRPECPLCLISNEIYSNKKDEYFHARVDNRKQVKKISYDVYFRNIIKS